MFTAIRSLLSATAPQRHSATAPQRHSATAILFTLCAALQFAPQAQAVAQQGPNPIVIDQAATTDNITYLDP